MQVEANAQTLEQTLRFLPVRLDSLDAHTLAMDLYLKTADGARHVLYRSVGVDFTAADQQRLIEQGVEFIYIPMHQHSAYRHMLTRRLDRLYHDPAMNRMERGRVVRTTCTRMIEEVLLFPQRVDTIHTVAEISRQFAAWATSDTVQFSYVLDMSAHDYYTATHMVNVGVGCGLLANDLKPDDTDLLAVLVQGGLLHDLGKRGVPEAILNKEGKLDAQEWQVMRRHPQIGYDELQDYPSMPGAVLDMAHGHHESLDGRGYPNGLHESQIGLPTRVCTVVDVFDAICAARPYRGPIPPLDALDIMWKGVGSQFDRDIMAAWARIVHRLIEEDQQRALPATGAPELSLTDLLHVIPVEPAAEDSLDPRALRPGDRRRHRRHNCDIRVSAAFLRQGKFYPVGLGRWFALRTVDVSQGGLQLRTPYPLALNDILEIKLPLNDGRTLKRIARVVRVRRASAVEWAAGLRFVDER